MTKFYMEVKIEKNDGEIFKKEVIIEDGDECMLDTIIGYLASLHKIIHKSVELNFPREI